MADEQGGIVVKTNDGDTYFIRDEILEACKVDGEWQEVTDQMVDEQSDEVSGFGFSFAQPVSYTPQSQISVQPNQLNMMELGSRFTTRETIMCCW